MTFRVWCQHAWLGGPSSSDGVLLEIDGERFARVEAGFPTPPPGIAVLPGLTLPGLVNPNHSVLARPARGRPAHTVAGVISGVHAGVTPEDVAELATAVYAELALSGVTSVGEVLTLHRERDGAPFANPSVISDALAHAAKTAGIRLAIIDVCELVGATRSRHTSAYEWVQRIDPWSERLGRSTTVRVVGGLSDLTGLGSRGISDVALWSGQCGLPVHARLDGPVHAGVTPLGALITAGATTNRGGFAAVAPQCATAEELSQVAQQRGAVVAEMAGRIEPFPIGSFRMSGGRVTVATPAWSNTDSFDAVRALAKLANDDPHCPPLRSSELMRSVTSDAASTLGWRDGGLLASGQLADLVTVSTASLHPVANEDILDTVIRTAQASAITHVAVGGQLLVNNGVHRLGDVSARLASALQRVERFTAGVFR